MVKQKLDDEYVNILTTVRLNEGVHTQMKTCVQKLGVSQSAFIRKAIRDAIAAAEVV